MELSKKAFKAYDIRGIVPGEVNAELAYRVGRVFAAMFAAETAVVGHDIRLTGRSLPMPLQMACVTAAAQFMILVSAVRKWFITLRRI